MNAVLSNKISGPATASPARAKKIPAKTQALVENRFRHLVEQSIVGIYVLQDDHLVYVNPKMTDIFGYSPEEWTSRPVYDFILAEDRALTRENIEKRMRDVVDSIHYELRMVRKDGKVVHVEAHGGKVEYNGRPAILGTLLDVTERKWADDVLRMQGRVLESMAEGVTVCDESGRIVFSNAACNAMFGYEPNELRRRHMSVLKFGTPEENRLFFEQVFKHLKENKTWAGEFSSRKKDGAALITRSRVSVLENAGSRSFVAVFDDITEKKGMEAQLLRSQRMESVGRLSSGIAHDLNNILTPIMMSVFMLRRQLPPEEFEKTISAIETSTQRGADLIKQLLTFGRGSGGPRLAVQPGALIRDVVKIIRGTFPKNITLSAAAAGNCWPVMADATQLHQVLLNLCVNARDAMPRGGTLSLATENVHVDESYAAMNAGSATGPYVLLRVADTGEGIPPEVIDKVFDPFFTTKEAGKGTGLGLSTVLGIVKSHNGFIRLHSKMGSGSTFEIYLPAAPDAAEPGVVAPSPPPPRGHGETILIVDDEPGIREVISKALLGHGYQVLAAEDGTEGIALYSLHRDRIKAVLTDVIMPFMDGVTMTRTLKKLNPSIKVIASSGIGSAEGQQEKAAELYALGVKTFLAKPYTACKVLAAIGESLAAP